MDIDPAILGTALIVGLPLVLLAGRIRFVPDGTELADMFTRHDDHAWPRGVQEEEPVRWRLERLTSPDRRSAAHARATRRVTATTAAGSQR